jgi:NADH:ubiquinone reductase (H+-translocating)
VRAVVRETEKRPGEAASREPRVVIVGAGFGGLYAARALADRPVMVTVIDRVNYHTFQPLLYQVATGVLSPGEIAQPIRRILSRAKNIQVLMAEVEGVDLDGSRVVLQGGTAVGYDYLVVSAGARHAYFGHDEWERNAPGLKVIDDAIAIRARVLTTFEEQERRAYLGETAAPVHFAVIGGGPTGVELAGAIKDIATRALRRDYKRLAPSDTRVTVFEGAPRILRDFPEDLSRRATEQLKELGVQVRTGSMVTGIRPGAIEIGGEWIPVSVAVWATGVAASPLGRLLTGQVDKGGRILVNADLSLPGRPNVFVLGDMASVTDAAGVHLPGLAAVATQEGRAAAENILRDLQGKKRREFRYRDKGMLATIGRNRAVAVIFGRHLSGLPAWLLWAFVHIYLLIGFRNRLAVFMDWVWAYFTRQRSSLLITGKEEK